MSSGEVYSRLAGLLLLWSVLPLPFLYIVMPPFWLMAGAVGLVLFLKPSWSVRLSSPVQNVLAVAIVVAVVAAGGIRVGPLRPLGHLLLLLTAVRTVQVADRPSFHRALPTIFLVWVISLAASTHVAALIYFAASAVLWWWAGMQIHLMGLLPSPGTEPTGTVALRHAAVAATAALLLAVPVFVVMPRLHAPWIAGRGGASSVTGFASRVDLSGVGTIQESQERALVVRSLSGEAISPRWLRLRATAYERVTVDSWAPRPADRRQPELTGLVQLAQVADRSETTRLEIALDHPKEYLFLPEGTVAVEVPAAVWIDPAGGVVLAAPHPGPLTYLATVAVDPFRSELNPPRSAGLDFSIHPDVISLAERITVGLDSAQEKATAIESHLRSEYGYSMTGMGGFGPDPVSWFLLRSRSGHCEYFAGGMVVLLDALGIPARMAAGYSGGTASPAGDEVVVREANAHAWVEVWLGADLGWVVYDPTPAVGVPGLSRINAADRLKFAWEWVQASWDRYVLTFGLGEQMALLEAASERIAAVWASMHWNDVGWLVGGAVVLWCAWSVFRWAMRLKSGSPGPRPRTPAAQAVRRLAHRLERDGVKVPASATVRWIGRAARFQWPRAAQPAGDLVWLAERELYAAGGSAYGVAEVRRVWADLRRAIRQS